MKKEEFLKNLKKLLKGLPKKSVDSYLKYYAEIIDDYVESGINENAAVHKLGDIEKIAHDILLDNEDSLSRRKVDVGAVVCFILAILLFAIHLMSSYILKYDIKNYYNVKEISLIFGVTLLFIGIEKLIFYNKQILLIHITVWIMIFVMTFARVLSKQIFISIIMNSTYTFWGLLIVLIVYGVLIIKREIINKKE